MNSPTDPAAAQVASEFRDLGPEERRRLHAREPAALELFYRTYFHRVYGYVRRLLREEHLAEDVTQDIFMSIHRSLPNYDPERELRPWVFTIATNKLRDHWRSRRHLEAQLETQVQDDESSFAVSRQRGPVEQLESRELGALVERAIDDMPDVMRTTLVLRYFEGLSFAEIGRMVNHNEVAVRKRYSRALAELRQSLGKVLDPRPGRG